MAAALEIPDATARQWSRAFSAGGADAVLGGGSRRMTYDLETKLDAVRDHLDRGKSIREVMAFPLNSSAQDAMVGAPSGVTEQQLREVHIKVRD